MNHVASYRPKLSIVVLCYKSGKQIISYIHQMERELHESQLLEYELVLVGNYIPGSNDATPEIIRDLAQKNPKIVPVTQAKKGMLGWDVMSGFRAATGDVIALIDGDGQMPSGDIVRLYRVLMSGEFDLVKTFRKKRLDGWMRKIMSQWFNLLFRICFPSSSYRDINSKPKIMTRTAYERMKLICDGWFIDGEMMLEAMRLDFNVAEVPTTFYENEWRGSFVGLKTVLEIFSSLVGYRIRYWFT